MAVLKAGAVYFLFVFGVGFLLGTIRVLWVVPQIGERPAELAEMPLMLGMIFLGARWLVLRMVRPPIPSKLLAAGAFALLLMVACEFTLVLSLRRLTISQYLAIRDPISGSAYVVSLALLALMPVLLAKAGVRA